MRSKWFKLLTVSAACIGFAAQAGDAAEPNGQHGAAASLAPRLIQPTEDASSAALLDELRRLRRVVEAQGSQIRDLQQKQGAGSASPSRVEQGRGTVQSGLYSASDVDAAVDAALAKYNLQEEAGPEAGMEQRLGVLENYIKKLQDDEKAKAAAAALKPSVKVGGRMMMDWTNFDQDELNKITVGDQENGYEFRRARIKVEGDLMKWMNYRIQLDFAGGEVAFKDVYITGKNIPYFGNVRAGHFKEPFSLEQLTSARFITFMERSLADVFAPERNVGVMAYDHSEDESLTWAYGVFRDTNDFAEGGQGDGSGRAFTGRLAWSPWYECDGEYVLHLGVDYSYRGAPNGELRYRQRPENHLSDRFVNTGFFDSDHTNLFGAEAALVYGPFSLQSELMYSFADQRGDPNPTFPGFYVYGSYFLTGEHRHYERAEGAFDRVAVNDSFVAVEDDGLRCLQGTGAWEVAARYSYLDLNDGNIQGGRLSDLTVGLNWYLNPYSRFMFNYVHAFLDDPVFDESNADIYAVRYQIDW